ncbi:MULTISPECIES: UDP-N-acetylmuramoyl-tripeptide--D-alanyl-D-alanine ligase [Marinomonas]|uniref:UDP-N-acetylmuramoyl-tripeptide--D-alanyl-D-alanine ligase n=1 Tax=Marinomonas arctica TaxID=383750 RepID=A0A7H1J1S1_9GAMM|nr:MULTISPECIES: UDP-N-acetylmuramoyl-tripeptide--D-alanyl-D-alanine ligase [Marinomonas]MCS7487900.1 UDP-N-acetylmuramoylalanyl-D-glutamate--2,6-diaminopimelate ligase [Marinomonas sp. BSi20414]QNT04437.1 UDP-N-acetylmuramoyl-tripeptide--D-alanyl-D-alanine ligase [Marinomonas arctica]GGN31877.1 UDP-N-acetylmuramoyl-tripeptide--D-alanyl-D-alanine ligase [Marinomonas arctica]
MLIDLTLSDIALACNGKLVGENCALNAVVTDTRKLSPGCLFVALKGARFDGHDYVKQAVDNGAIAVVSEHDVDVPNYVKVADTSLAYGAIARLIRGAFKGPVVCITGSNGKTTVKDWLAQSLSGKNVLKTRANLNNQIGVPQTLLELEKHHDVAVIETGTSFLGEIPLLARIAFPDVVILTNASGSHFEGLGSLEGIAKEKGGLISGAAPDASIILNADDAFFDYWCGIAAGRKVYSFGFTESADLYASDLVLGAESSTAIFHYSGTALPVLIAGAGRHQIANGMAVVLAMLVIGVDFKEAVAKLASPVLVSGRLERLKTKNGALLINDCYNASPSSVKAAIDVLAIQSVEETWLILGALAELGDQRDSIHNELGMYAKGKGISCLICVGPVAGIAGAAFRSAGGNAIFCNTHNEAATVVRPLDKKHAILVKGSRSAKMENVIEALIN